jgi:hypothetical protein
VRALGYFLDRSILLVLWAWVMRGDPRRYSPPRALGGTAQIAGCGLIAILQRLQDHEGNMALQNHTARSDGMHKSYV